MKNIIEKFVEPQEIIDKIQEKAKLEQDFYVVESDVNRLKSNIIYDEISVLKKE